MSEEEIAARHFVTPAIVKQRLRLASVSPKLHDVYADDGMTLEQLMAFTVTGDHARQEQTWDSVSRSGNDEPYEKRKVRSMECSKEALIRIPVRLLMNWRALASGARRSIVEFSHGGARDKREGRQEDPDERLFLLHHTTARLVRFMR